MLKSVLSTFLFYKKNVREKVDFFEMSKVCYFLLVGGTDIIFGLL